MVLHPRGQLALAFEQAHYTTHYALGMCPLANTATTHGSYIDLCRSRLHHGSTGLLGHLHLHRPTWAPAPDDVAGIVPRYIVCRVPA